MINDALRNTFHVFNDGIRYLIKSSNYKMGAKKEKEAEPRTLRKRIASVNYNDANADLDDILGTDDNKGPKRLDVVGLRRKVERACPATPLSGWLAPDEVLPTLIAEGFRQPHVVRAKSSGNVTATREKLGIQLPLQLLSPSGLIKAVGPDHEVPTFDVASQDSGPRMTVKQLAEYYKVAPADRSKLINVVSFSLAGTALEVSSQNWISTKHKPLLFSLYICSFLNSLSS